MVAISGSTFLGRHGAHEGIIERPRIAEHLKIGELLRRDQLGVGDSERFMGGFFFLRNFPSTRRGEL